jgi:enoyl-CoA hydratase/carnithine racemase
LNRKPSSGRTVLKSFIEETIVMETLRYEVEDNIGRLTLNRPEALNAINETMLEELESFWAERQNDPDTRVIIMGGAGEKGFCAGLDLKDALPRMLELDVRGFHLLQQRMSRQMAAMRRSPQPIIAALFGPAVGAGFSLALAADVRFISPDARFGAAYINVGFGGADLGSSYFLPRLIGAGRAYEYLLTGQMMDAETALNLGLVSRIVDREQLADTALEMARVMCRKNPLGLRLTKEAINLNLDAAGLDSALEVENRNQALCFATLRHEGQSPITK